MHTVCGGWDASVKQEKDHSQSMHNIFAMRKYTTVKHVICAYSSYSMTQIDLLYYVCMIVHVYTYLI